MSANLNVVCRYIYIWVFPKIGVPQNGWFIMKNPIKMYDFGVPLFLGTPIYMYNLNIYDIELMVSTVTRVVFPRVSP